MLTVKDIERSLGVKPTTIKYYEDIGVIEKGRIDSGGRGRGSHKVYPPVVLDILKRIKSLQEDGLSLKEIKEVLQEEFKGYYYLPECTWPQHMRQGWSDNSYQVWLNTSKARSCWLPLLTSLFGFFPRSLYTTLV